MSVLHKKEQRTFYEVLRFFIVFDLLNDTWMFGDFIFGNCFFCFVWLKYGKKKMNNTMVIRKFAISNISNVAIQKQAGVPCVVAPKWKSWVNKAQDQATHYELLSRMNEKQASIIWLWFSFIYNDPNSKSHFRVFTSLFFSIRFPVKR